MDDDFFCTFGKTTEKVFYVGRDFRCASGDVDGLEADPGSIGNDVVHGFDRHHLPALWSCFKVAVVAQEITEESHVDLKGAGLPAHKVEPVPSQFLVKWFDQVHRFRLNMLASGRQLRTHKESLSAMP